MIIKTEVGRRKIEENGKLKAKGKRLVRLRKNKNR